MLEFPVISSDANRGVYNSLVIENCAYDFMQVLCDTGAYLPTWVDGLDSFMSVFPNGTFANAQAILAGFGKGYEVAPVYVVPDFKLTDSNGNGITIQNTYVTVPTERDFSFQMILAFPIFNKMNVNYISYTNSNNNLKVIKPLLRLNPHKNKYHMNGKFVLPTTSAIAKLEKRYPDLRHYLNIDYKIVVDTFVFSQK